MLDLIVKEKGDVRLNHSPLLASFIFNHCTFINQNHFDEITNKYIITQIIVNHILIILFDIHKTKSHTKYYQTQNKPVQKLLMLSYVFNRTNQNGLGHNKYQFLIKSQKKKAPSFISIETKILKYLEKERIWILSKAEKLNWQVHGLNFNLSHSIFFKLEK